MAERRRASLERRSIDAFIPAGIRIAVYAAVGLHLAAWVAAGATATHVTSADAFWAMAASQLLIAAALLVVVQIVVRRSPQAMDRIFGPRLRRTAVWLAFLAQLWPLVNGFARLREQITGTALLDVDRAARLALVLFMIASVLAAFGRFAWPSPSEPTRRSSTSPSSTRASALLCLVAISILG